MDGIAFFSEKGSVMITTRALYPLKSSGAAWCAKLDETFKAMGYKYTESEPDVWLKCSMKPNGFDYYKYIILYVHGIIHLTEDTKPDMNILKQVCRLKEEDVGSPDIHIKQKLKR